MTDASVAPASILKGINAHPDVALVGGADASLDVDALRPLGLLSRDWTDTGGMVFAGNMANEGTHWREQRTKSSQHHPHWIASHSALSPTSLSPTATPRTLTIFIGSNV